MLMSLMALMATGFLLLPNDLVDGLIQKQQQANVNVFSMVLHHNQAIENAKVAGFPLGEVSVSPSGPFRNTQDWKSQVIDDHGIPLLVTYARDFNRHPGVPWPLHHAHAHLLKLESQSSRETLMMVTGNYRSTNRNKHWIGDIRVPSLGNEILPDTPTIATWVKQ